MDSTASVVSSKDSKLDPKVKEFVPQTTTTLEDQAVAIVARNAPDVELEQAEETWTADLNAEILKSSQANGTISEGWLKVGQYIKIIKEGEAAKNESSKKIGDLKAALGVLKGSALGSAKVKDDAAKAKAAKLVEIECLIRELHDEE